MTRRSREECGNLVFEALCDADPTWQEVCETTGLTRDQFNAGVCYVKDLLADDHSTPLLFDPKTNRYSLALSSDGGPVKDYERLRLRVMHRQLGRLISGTAKPAAEKFGSVSARRMLRYLNGAVEELDLLLAEVEPASPANGQVSTGR